MDETSLPVRYGVLGFGLHAAKRLAPAFAQARRSTLAALWRRDGAKAAITARQFHIPLTFATAEELCASPEIDAVFVASPDALHLPHVRLALQAGKPVLCEKPLGMNAGEVRAMLAASGRAARLLGVAQNFRYNRSVQLIRDWVAAGRVGEIVLAHAQFCYDAGKATRAWIYDPRLACGGPIGDVGVHCIDALRFVLEDEVLSVTAAGVGDAASGPLESRACLGLEFSRGCIGAVSVTTRSAYRSLVEVVGAEGVISSENALTVEHPVEVVLRVGGRAVETQVVSNGDAYSMMLDAFSMAVQGSRNGSGDGSGNFASPGKEGLRNQLVLDSAYASLRTGRRESVPQMHGAAGDHESGSGEPGGGGRG